MAEYLIQGETLTSIADKIRVLSGAEGAMTPAQMDGNLGEVNTEVVDQADLIAQIASALEGKASNSGSISYDTCAVTITIPGGILYGYCATCFEEGNIIYKHGWNSTGLGGITIPNVICGSSFTLLHEVNNGNVGYYNTELVGKLNNIGSIFIAPSSSEMYAMIEIGQSSGGASQN